MEGINLVRSVMGSKLAADYAETWSQRVEFWEDRERAAEDSKSRRLCRSRIVFCAIEAAEWARQIPEL